MATKERSYSATAVISNLPFSTPRERLVKVIFSETIVGLVRLPSEQSELKRLGGQSTIGLIIPKALNQRYIHIYTPVVRTTICILSKP